MLGLMEEDKNLKSLGVPMLTGFMIKKGRLFPTWHRRYFELYSKKLIYYSDENKLSLKGIFKLQPDMMCKDSLTRNFCFCLFQPGNDKRNEILYLATYTMEEKENWMGTIIAAISLLRASTKSRSFLIQSENINSLSDHEFENLKNIATGGIQSRSRLQLKIIQARGFENNDYLASSSYFVQINVGSSSVRTSTQGHECNPIWNETFSFEFDSTTRFANCELWAEEKDIVIGAIEISLMSILSTKSVLYWYPLGRKNQSYKGGNGEIQIEITCTKESNVNEHLLRFFENVKMCPHLRVIQKYQFYVSSESQSEGPISNFFDAYPPIDCEILEDFYSTVALTCTNDDEKVFCVGTLLLSNYRLIFLENIRLQNFVGEHAFNKTSLLTNGIALGDITNCVMATQFDDNVGAVVDIIRLKTVDSRIFSFAFLEDLLDRDNTQANNWKPEDVSTASGVLSNLTSVPTNLKQDQEIFGFLRCNFADQTLQQAFMNACKDFPGFYSIFDANDSFEGPASQRISKRLKSKILNRHNMKYSISAMHSLIIEKLLGMSGIERLGASSEKNKDYIFRSSSSLNALESTESEFGLLKNYLNSLSEEETAELLPRFVDSWKLYSPIEEYKRFDIPNDHWRLFFLNIGYEVTNTYPEILVVPAAANDDLVLGSIKFRSKGRFPALSWLNKSNKCSITRCSQPLVGLTMNRSADDEQFLKLINNAGGSGKPLIIADARPKLNAQANQAAGKGFEFESNYKNSKILFLGIANIHAIRKSYEDFVAVCSSKTTDKANFLKGIDASGWLEHIRRILDSSVRIAHWNMVDCCNVLVHCSDGWDRTPQLTSLPMIMLDPYYRTLKGFQILIEQEWFSFGHKFHDRSGWTTNGWKDEDRSPIFEQFLNCVYIMLSQMPAAFEFNEQLLLFIAENMYNGWFGNFMSNTDQERKTQYDKTFSIWYYVNHHKKLFLSNSYDKNIKEFIPHISSKNIIVWHKRFLWWNDAVWKFKWDEISKEFKEEDSFTGGSWLETDSVQMCSGCSSSFGLFKRRHVCKSCGLVYCQSCLGNSKTCSSCSILESHSNPSAITSTNNKLRSSSIESHPSNINELSSYAKSLGLNK